MPLVILHNLLNVPVQLANKRGLKNVKTQIWLRNFCYLGENIAFITLKLAGTGWL
jgi:hypothetical protein